MGKQFSILLTDVDLAALEKLLRKSGDVDLLSSTPTADGQTLPSLQALPIPIAQAGKTSVFCYLAPVGLPQHIVLMGVGVVKVDQTRSHLIEVWRSHYDGQIIKRGRLWYENKVDGNPKDPDFCRWADLIMARVRRSLTYNKNADAYIGADALSKLASGAITQRSNLNEDSIVPFKGNTS